MLHRKATPQPHEPAPLYPTPTHSWANTGILNSFSHSEGLSVVKTSIIAKKIHLFDIPDRPVRQGGPCDIFIGTHTPTGAKLALKRPRLSTSNEEDTLRRLRREANMWSTFDHDNILPFLGIIQINTDTYLASPWMEQDDLSVFSSARVEYLKVEEERESPRESRPPNPKHQLYYTFDERQILQGIASGITYLHSMNFVHGDLKGKNVLLGEHNKPLLCDFGMTKALDSPSANTSTGMKGVGTLRWQSPELFENASKTFKSDVYAFAIIIVEVLTGSPPLPDLTDFTFLSKAIHLNERPLLEPKSRRGIDFLPLWRIATDCWAEKPDSRPSINGVLEELKVMSLWAEAGTAFVC